MPSAEHIQPAKLLAHAAGLRRLALALTHEAEFADDVVQQTLSAALERQPDVTEPLGPWLARVARNWIAKTRRTRSRRLGIEARAARAEALPSAQDLVIRAELHRELVAVVLSLDERQRDVILLRYLEGLAPREIAARLNVPLRTVNTWLARGLVRLRDELDRSGGRERWLHGFMLLPRASRGPFALGVVAMKLKLLVAASVIVVALFMGFYVRTRPEAIGAGTPSVATAPLIEAPTVAPELAPGSRTTAAALAPKIPAQKIDAERVLIVSVVTTDGAPIPDATLAVVNPGARQVPGLIEWNSAELDQLVAQARTDADGHCTFHLEPRRVYDVTASAAGFARVASRSLYAGEQLRIVLPQGASLHGGVNSSTDGAPIVGARVKLGLGVIGSLGDDGFETRTDASGQFELAALPADYAQVYVDAEGFPSLFESVGVLREGERRELRLELRPGTLVRGQVTDGSTKLPIAGATVEIVGSRDSHRAITDAEGRYMIPGAIPGESTELTARANGYGDFQINVPGVASGEVVEDFFLLPGRSAKGRVVDTHGTPVANAQIVACAQSYFQFTNQYERRRVHSDAEGRFEITGLRVDLRHTLLLHAAGMATAVRDFPQSEWDTMELDLGDIALTAPAAIAGHVRDRSGIAVVGRWVLLDAEPRDRDVWKPSTDREVGYMDGEGFGFGRILARTDERGRYAFGELPGGSYRLWAGDKGFARGAELKLDLQDGEQLLDVDLELDTEPSIRGVVVDSVGRALPDIGVDAYPANTPDPMPARATYALTGSDGSFSLCGLEPGNYDLRCKPFIPSGDKNLRVAQVTLRSVAAPTRDLRIALPRALETSVRVLGPDGQPVHGASVLLADAVPSHGAEVLGSTDPDGRFTLWLGESTTARLRVAPPFGSILGGYVPVVDSNGKLDFSYEVEVSDLRAGSSDCVVRFTRLP